MKNQFLKLTLGTLVIVSACGVAQAQTFGSSSQYSQVGVEACNKAESYDRQDCLESIRGVAFDQALRGFCAYKVSKYDIIDCLKASADKRYDLAEVRLCEQEESYNRVDCIKRFGQTSVTMSPTDDVLSDVLDQVLTDLINEYFGTSASNASEICEIQNSAGRVLGRVSREDFKSTVKQYAIRKNSCVVSNVKNETRSRDLVMPNGRFAGQEMTEQEINNKKASLGYDRCSILNFVSQESQRPRARSNRHNGYNGGVVHESWGLN